MTLSIERYDAVIRRLQALADPEAVDGMSRVGIPSQRALGIHIPQLRSLAREIGRNHDLAEALWQSGSHEARILASMVDDPAVVTGEQMDRWALSFDAWDVCDQCCINLFWRTPYAWEKAFAWSCREEEFVKRAGFVLMAKLAVSDKRAADGLFEQCFLVILAECNDPRNFVKKAVNWALRQIGKRNRTLNEGAIICARTMQRLSTAPARWIASDALRELTGERVQERLRRERDGR
jgi:3-methyladenine DNA glycosylase AlkD